MIEALAYAGRHLNDSRYVQAAVTAADGVFELLGPDVSDSGHLLRVHRNGRARHAGYLDDFAYMTLALLELHETTQDARWLTTAGTLADEMIERFEDRDSGAFFFSAEHHDELIMRSKGLTGGGNLPSGNGVAVRV